MLKLLPKSQPEVCDCGEWVLHGKLSIADTGLVRIFYACAGCGRVFHKLLPLRIIKS